jgi:tetratricopeptide (TPR) repeat protein
MKNILKNSLMQQTLLGLWLGAACLVMQPPLLAQAENPTASPADSLFQDAYKAQDPARQARLYREYLKLKPDDATAWNNLGIALKRQGDYEAAVSSYRKAIQKAPEGDKPLTAKIYNNLGEALRLQNKTPEALAAFNKALELDPKLGFAYNNVGKIYFSQNRLEDAIVSFQKAVSLTPNEVEPQGNLAGALIAAKRYQEAIRAAEQGVKLDPKDPITRYNLGLALMKQAEIELKTAQSLFEEKGDQKNSARVSKLLKNFLIDSK